MILGVILHSAQIYNPDQTWLLMSPNTSPLMKAIVEFLSAFRMPAFFILSGYFCCLTLKKYSVRKFINVRIQRLIIPFLACAITLNSVQALFLNDFDFNIFNQDYFFSGKFVSHLWFLTNLIVYFTFASIIYYKFCSILTPVTVFFKSLFTKLPMPLILLGAPLTNIAVLSLNKFGFPLYSSLFGVFNTFSILIYSPFFIFGLILATDKSFLKRFSQTNPIIALLLYITSILSLDSFLIESVLLESYFTYLSYWSLTAFVYFVFYRFLNFKSSSLAKLSESSYSIYLFHHLAVIALGSLFLFLEMSIWLSFLILIVSVSLITYMIHKYLIAENRHLLFIFNGKNK